MFKNLFASVRAVFLHIFGSQTPEPPPPRKFGLKEAKDVMASLEASGQGVGATTWTTVRAALSSLGIEDVSKEETRAETLKLNELAGRKLAKIGEYEKDIADLRRQVQQINVEASELEHSLLSYPD